MPSFQGGVNKVANLTAAEKLHIETVVDERMKLIEQRISNAHNQKVSEMNLALDTIKDGAARVEEVYRELARFTREFEAWTVRVEDLEQEAGW